MGSIFHILLRSVYSGTLAIEHKKSRHDHSNKGEDTNQNERVLNTHPGDPGRKCEPDDHCKGIANEHDGDKSIIKDLDLLSLLVFSYHLRPG